MTEMNRHPRASPPKPITVGFAKVIHEEPQSDRQQGMRVSKGQHVARQQRAPSTAQSILYPGFPCCMFELVSSFAKGLWIRFGTRAGYVAAYVGPSLHAQSHLTELCGGRCPALDARSKRSAAIGVHAFPLGIFKGPSRS